MGPKVVLSNPQNPSTTPKPSGPRQNHKTCPAAPKPFRTPRLHLQAGFFFWWDCLGEKKEIKASEDEVKAFGCGRFSALRFMQKGGLGLRV